MVDPIPSSSRQAVWESRNTGIWRPFRLLLALSILIPALMFVAAAWYDYGIEHEDARQALTTGADALGEHAQKVLETNQLAIALIEERIGGLSWAQIQRDPSIHEYLVRLTRELPQVESAFLVDQNGRDIASSRAFPLEPIDVSARDYVKDAFSKRTPQLYVSRPFRGLLGGTIAFTLSRARVGPNGPDGVIGITLSEDYFSRFYRSLIPTGSTARASLLRDDGTYLVRYPPDPTSELASRTMLASKLGTTAGVQVVTALGLPGNERRIIAYRHLTGFPVFAAYSVSAAGALSAWYTHTIIIGVFAAVLSAVLFASIWSTWARVRRDRENLALLLAETARRERAEDSLRQLQKIEALGQLTGGVAHDFNNLLTAVLGSLELAIKRIEEPRILRLLRDAMEAAKRGARLTQHMLAFSRQQKIELVAVDVNEVLRSTQDLLQRSIGPGIAIRLVADEEAWPALADTTQLEMALLNLAINARDAMPNGGDLTLATSRIAAAAPRGDGMPSGDLVAVSVTDTGTGMSPEVARRAVEPFFTTKSVGRGTGLGLSMVHGFARQAGGGLAISSAPGAGTTVTLYLARAAFETGGSDPGEPPSSPQAPLDILVIDDDDTVRSLTAEMLRELDHRVSEAADGFTGIAAVKRGPTPDLVVVDYAMPGMNGGEVARSLAAWAPSLPIIFVTGYAEGDALQEWTARGFAVVAKPFTLPDLAQAIARALPASERSSHASASQGLSGER